MTADAHANEDADDQSDNSSDDLDDRTVQRIGWFVRLFGPFDTGAERSVDEALGVVAEMEAEGIDVPPEYHAAVLDAYFGDRRFDEAEDYFERIAAAGRADSRCYALRFAVCSVRRRPDDAERLYFDMVARGVDITDHARAAFLDSLCLGDRRDVARRWADRFFAETDEPSADLYAGVVEVYGQPETRRRLWELHDELPERLRRNGIVARAFVHAFAATGAPDVAERWLPNALAVSDLIGRRELIESCAYEYALRGRYDEVVRLGKVAEQCGVDLHHLLPAEPSE